MANETVVKQLLELVEDCTKTTVEQLITIAAFRTYLVSATIFLLIIESLRQCWRDYQRHPPAAQVPSERQPKLKWDIRVLSERDAIDAGQILMGLDVGEACCGHQLIARIALVVTMLQ